MLAEAEARAVDTVVDDSAAQAHAQRTRTLWLTGLILAVLVIALGSWLILGRSMVRSLRDLRAQALDVAQRRLPEALERLRTAERQADIDNLPTTAFPQLGGDKSRSDEIGEVGDAFAAVHASAVQLAGEQAELRRGANAMIVNVARRSQMLVERQLKLLDEVQSRRGGPGPAREPVPARPPADPDAPQRREPARAGRRRHQPPPARPGAAVRGGARRDGRDRGVRAGRLRRRRRRLRGRPRGRRRGAHPGRTAGERHVVLAAGHHRPVIGRVAPTGARRTSAIADRGLGMSEKKLAEANERLGPHRSGRSGAGGGGDRADGPVGGRPPGRPARHLGAAAGARTAGPGGDLDPGAAARAAAGPAVRRAGPVGAPQRR